MHILPISWATKNNDIGLLDTLLNKLKDELCPQLN